MSQEPERKNRLFALDPWEQEAVEWIDRFRVQAVTDPSVKGWAIELRHLIVTEARKGSGAQGKWRVEDERDLAANHDPHDPLSRESTHVLRLGNLRRQLSQDPWRTATIEPALLQALHRALQDPEHSSGAVPGQWKTGDNTVTLYDEARQPIRDLDVCSPDAAKAELVDAFAVFHDKVSHPAVHTLDAIAELEGRLMWIHPFKDGNGRVARTLSTLLMLRHEYAFANWVGIEHHFHEVELEGDAAWRAYRRYFLDRIVAMVAFIKERVQGDRWA